jgi:hypothetical protein
MPSDFRTLPLVFPNNFVEWVLDRAISKSSIELLPTETDNKTVNWKYFLFVKLWQAVILLQI